MYKIDVYKERPNTALIKQVRPKRDWMDDSWGKHAYHCFPVTQANRLGWELCFPEDITFIWDGSNNPSSHHVTILKGHQFCHTGRGNGTISFITGLTFRTDEDLTLMQLPVPNNFNMYCQAFTTVLSTSFYPGEMPVSFKILVPNVEITIKAFEPIISIVPIPLGLLQDSVVTLMDGPTNFYEGGTEREKIMIKASQKGEWSHFYINAVDHNGNSVGKHEVKTLNFHVDDRTSGDQTAVKEHKHAITEVGNKKDPKF